MAWHKAHIAGGVGKLAPVEGKPDPKYTGLTFHDLGRSAARNLRKAGVPESEVVAIGGWKTNAVFRRYDIVDTQDVAGAMDRLEIHSTGYAWEVVQLVGLQTLDLAILVRVQASQPSL